jgi:6,7-dimethyl-8-ribityllumazine synthase
MQREQQTRKKNKNAEDLSVALVVSEYNSDITYPMRDAAIKTLKDAGVKDENIFVSEAPGGFEIPILCQRLAKTNKYNGIIAIGCVIRGDTDHYVYIANEATRGVMDVMLKYDIPIANAILTVNNLEQAKIRSEGDANKGVEAAKALLASID